MCLTCWLCCLTRPAAGDEPVKILEVPDSQLCNADAPRMHRAAVAVRRLLQQQEQEREDLRRATLRGVHQLAGARGCGTGWREASAQPARARWHAASEQPTQSTLLAHSRRLPVPPHPVCGAADNAQLCKTEMDKRRRLDKLRNMPVTKALADAYRITRR